MVLFLFFFFFFICLLVFLTDEVEAESYGQKLYKVEMGISISEVEKSVLIDAESASFSSTLKDSGDQDMN